MTRPERFLTRMVLFLAAVLAVCAAIYEHLRFAFAANPALNGLIFGVLLLGVGYMLRLVFRLRREVAWLEHYQSKQAGDGPAPVLLAPMANMLGERKGRLQLSALSMRSLLDGISARLDESRELSRYLIGLLIFLGLLGTFWGLLGTVRSVSGVINTLTLEGKDVAMMFQSLQRGLEAPLSGMGTAFSASLFGLAGSLVLGFLELQVAQAQQRFFLEVEDWLSGATRLSTGAGGLEGGEQSVPVYVQALLEQTAENLELLHHTITSSEDGRRQTSQNMMMLVERLTTLTDQMRAEQQLLVKLAEGQLDMKTLLSRASERDGFDDASRQHLRNIDVYLARLIEDQANGRTQTVSEIRSEIKVLTRTIAALAEEAEPR
jgi:membrane associated rhomboid family serine protease